MQPDCMAAMIVPITIVTSACFIACLWMHQLICGHARARAGAGQGGFRRAVRAAPATPPASAPPDAAAAPPESQPETQRILFIFSLDIRELLVVDPRLYAQVMVTSRISFTSFPIMIESEEPTERCQFQLGRTDRALKELPRLHRKYSRQS